MARPCLAVALLAAAALLAPVPAQTPSRDTSFGEWPFLVGNMDSQIATLVNAAKSNDLDTIYINFYRAEGPSTGTLWITDSAGKWNAAWGPVRPSGTGINLVNFISAAHAANLQVVAVMKCFDATVQPTDAAHRQYLWNVVDYLVNTYDASGKPVYDVDGIALDYVRFVGGSGVNATLVTDWVKGVRQRCGVLQVHAYLIAGRYDFDGPTYDGVFNSYATVMTTLKNGFGQDWEALAPYVDCYMPMAYTADGSIYSTYALHHAYVKQVTAYARTAVTRAGYPTRRVSPTIRTYSDSETCTAQTVEASITGALLGGGDGYQAFRYGTLAPHADWMAKLKAYAVPGQNRPIAVLSAPCAGLSVDADSTQSRDADEPSTGLQVRYDWQSDGVFDTPWQQSAKTPWLAPRPGPTRIGLQVRDSQGLLGQTTRLVAVPDPLSASPTSLSLAAPQKVTVALNAGPAGAGYAYLVLGTLSGTTPGIPAGPGLVLPLRWDGLTDGLLAAVNTPLFANGFGSCDAQGRGSAVLDLPPGLGVLAGKTLHFAALGASPGLQIAFVTNATPLSLLP